MQPLSDLPGILLQVAVKADEKTKNALEQMALKVEREAKSLLHTSSHTYGTPTPAREGGPPSLISGDLSRSVGHESARGGLEVRIGPDDSPHGASGMRNRLTPITRAKTRRSAGAGSGTANGKIGLYLETGLKNRATYPFMKPALDNVKDNLGDEFTKQFEGGW